jgi:hypothetical protein
MGKTVLNGRTCPFKNQRECVSIDVSSSSIILHKGKELLKGSLLLNLKSLVLQRVSCEQEHIVMGTNIKDIQDIVSSASQRSFFFFNHVPEQVKWRRA